MATPLKFVNAHDQAEVCQVEESHQENLKLNISERPAAKKRQVGFDCEFIEHPPKPFQSDCPVCLLVLREPHQVTCCGYGFCRVCIERVQTDKKSCPTCNQKDFTVFPDLRLQRSLYEFRVWCSHKTEGCEWSGELSQLDKHLNESPKLHEQLVGCQFTEVECHHCCEQFQRRYVTAHQIGQCIRRPFSCDYCGNYGADFEDVTTKHWPVCGSRPVPCPNECGTYPERQNLQHHVNKDCPLTVVNCDFHYTGCEVQLPCKDMPTHLAENLVTHVSQIATYTQRKIREKDEQIMTLTLETQALRNVLFEKETEIAQLKAKQEEDRSSLRSLRLYTGLPVEFTMTEFEKHKQDRDKWYSEPFYTHHHGYRMCLRVDANGSGLGQGKYVSVFCCLMQGEFDNLLRWPFLGQITIQLMDQHEPHEHHTKTFYFNTAGSDITSRVSTGERALGGCGIPMFIAHTDLGYDPTNDRQFLKDNCLHVRVTQATNHS